MPNRLAIPATGLRLRGDSDCRGLRTGFREGEAEMSGFLDTVRSYLSIYKATAQQAWHNLTPQQYASILILVAVVGFISMRGKAR